VSETASWTETHRALEAILLVADEPAEPQLLAQLLEVSPARVEELCGELAARYVTEEHGFVLVKVAGGWRYQTAPDLAAYVERFALEGQSARMSAAALETLAIVAYKQPLSRAQIGAIRGVNVDGVMRTLQHRGYIEEVARDPGPGQAVLFGTTRLFLEKLGLSSLDDLPPLGEFVPSAEVVEALEQGLRITPDATLDDSAEGDTGAPPAVG
jgi:segregation and condensation protein B